MIEISNTQRSTLLLHHVTTARASALQAIVQLEALVAQIDSGTPEQQAYVLTSLARTAGYGGGITSHAAKIESAAGAVLGLVSIAGAP